VGDEGARRRLVVAYAPLVKYVAARIGPGLPGQVAQTELIAHGLDGLVSAIDRFDPDRAAGFEPFAITSIRAAIVDQLREVDRVPRSVRARAREIERANRKLESALERAPTDEEMVAELGLSLEDFHDAIEQISHSPLVALDQQWSAPAAATGAVSVLDTARDRNGPDLRRPVGLNQFRNRIAAAIAALPEREQVVLALHYAENLTLREIGEVLGVTESRVSQLHTKAALRLRSKLS
jgi:RNA polymerase sigma factor for flagellar operon FliA